MKKYAKDDITITWEHEKCIHAEKCWRNLNEVFKPKGRPWIQPEGASSEAIMKQIGQCPSGALGFYLNKAEDLSNDSPVQVHIFKDGPFKIEGDVVVNLSNGEEELKSGAAFCRCGASGNKPYCDGSHRKISFEG